MAELYTNDISILAKSNCLKKQFDCLNILFRQVHLALSNSRSVNVSTTIDIQNKLINPYMSHYRDLFPNKTIPKQHILKHHCTEFMRIHKFGLSLLSEQGTEASHQSISKIASRANGIINEKDRLHFILQTHIVSVCPLVNKSVF